MSEPRQTRHAESCLSNAMLPDLSSPGCPVRRGFCPVRRFRMASGAALPRRQAAACCPLVSMRRPLALRMR